MVTATPVHDIIQDLSPEINEFDPHCTLITLNENNLKKFEDITQKVKLDF